MYSEVRNIVGIESRESRFRKSIGKTRARDESASDAAILTET